MCLFVWLVNNIMCVSTLELADNGFILRGLDLGKIVEALLVFKIPLVIGFDDFKVCTRL